MEASVALLILASSTAGALAVGLLGLITQIRTGFTIWNYKNKAKHFAKELEDLKKQKQTLLDDLAAINAEFELLRQEKQQPRQQDNTATAAEMTVETAGETMHDSE